MIPLHCLSISEQWTLTHLKCVFPVLVVTLYPFTTPRKVRMETTSLPAIWRFCSFPSAVGAAVAATIGAAVAATVGAAVAATVGAAVAATIGAAVVAATIGAAVAALGGAAVVELVIAVDATVVAFSAAGGTSGTVRASALLPFAACGKILMFNFYLFHPKTRVLTLGCKIR